MLSCEVYTMKNLYLNKSGPDWRNNADWQIHVFPIQSTWTIFLLCFSTVTLFFVTLSTRGYLCHVLQRWFIRMPLCKRLQRRILWKRWIVWHGFVTDIHPTTLNTIILKWLIQIFLLNFAARKCSKIASENI